VVVVVVVVQDHHDQLWLTERDKVLWHVVVGGYLEAAEPRLTE